VGTLRDAVERVLKVEKERELNNVYLSVDYICEKTKLRRCQVFKALNTLRKKWGAVETVKVLIPKFRVVDGIPIREFAYETCVCVRLKR